METKVKAVDVDWRSEVLEARRGNAQTVALYSKLASLYEIYAWLTITRARRRVLELADVRDGEAVLEIPAGTGVQLVELARRNPSGLTAGIEPAEGMLAQTRKRLDAHGLARVELHKASALQIPLEDESFDLVTSSYVVDLLPRIDIPLAVGEFKRLLRPGGRLVLSNMTRGERPLHRVWDALYARGISLTANCRGVFSAPVVKELGFDDVKREYVAQTAFPTEIVTARKPA